MHCFDVDACKTAIQEVHGCILKELKEKRVWRTKIKNLMDDTFYVFVSPCPITW